MVLLSVFIVSRIVFSTRRCHTLPMAKPCGSFSNEEFNATICILIKIMHTYVSCARISASGHCSWWKGIILYIPFMGFGWSSNLAATGSACLLKMYLPQNFSVLTWKIDLCTIFCQAFPVYSAWTLVMIKHGVSVSCQFHAILPITNWCNWWACSPTPHG